jgi:hypothetical protein
MTEAADLNPLPADPEELARCLADPLWRVTSGCLYKIIVKGDDEEEGSVLPFRPNRAQRRFIRRLWHRNLILKARQLGFTTLVCILWLDHALFNANQRCGIVAQDKDTAEAIFRDKVGFAYDNLPEVLRAQMPTAARNTREILFAHNNTSIRVATSVRGGTIHRLHVSEYGKICAKFPDKAIEVQTGSFPAVPSTGIIVIESTAEGREGDFYKRSKRAQELAQMARALGMKDYRFHFYPWWDEPKYRLDPQHVVITRDHERYFAEVEAEVHKSMGVRLVLDDWQKAWWVATFQGEAGSDDALMWREYPSYPEEAFKVSTQGAYYAQQLADTRRHGRIGDIPYLPGVPVHTFWDLGLNDVQAIWFMQEVGAQHRFIHYYENSGEGVSHYARYLQDMGFIYGRHHLPHDGAARRVTMEKPETYEDMLRKAGVKNIRIVPRIHSVTTGIQMTREAFPQCWFDEKGCAKGLVHLGNYKKEWNTRLGCWSDHPRHDEASNGADAFRQYGQDYKAGRRGASHRPKKTSWRTA